MKVLSVPHGQNSNSIIHSAIFACTQSADVLMRESLTAVATLYIPSSPSIMDSNFSSSCSRIWEQLNAKQIVFNDLMINLFKLILGLSALQLTALGSIVFTTIAILVRQKFTIKYPDNLPRIRENGRTRFSLRTRLAWYTDCKSLFQDAYETVCPLPTCHSLSI